MVLEGRTFLATFKKYGRFEGGELGIIIVAIALMGFTYSFNNWGTTSFELMTGFSNLVMALLISAIVLSVHVLVQKAYALSIGLNIKFKLWVPGIIAALLLMIVSRGYIFFFGLLGTKFIHMPGHRVGYFRYGLNREDMGRISLIGLIASLVLASIFALIRSALPNIFMGNAVIIALALAFFMALPLPPLPGFHIFASNRMMFAMTLAFTIIYAYVLYLFGVWVAVPGTILLLVLGHLAWTKWIRKKG